MLYEVQQNESVGRKIQNPSSVTYYKPTHTPSHTAHQVQNFGGENIPFFQTTGRNT
jgi:hypothetical protein